MSRRLAVILLVALVSTACSTFKVPRYGLSAENVVGLRKLGEKVNVGGFTASPPGRAEIGCRGRGPVKTLDERPFEDYIRRALIEEFKLAEMLSESAPVTLTGNLSKLDFSSTKGQWFMDMTVTSSNGRSLAVSSVYEYNPGPVLQLFGNQSSVDERACAETAQAFPAAVQVMIGKFVHHPDFATLLK